MYATTYDIDFDDDYILVELVLVDDIIFYNGGHGYWYLSHVCRFGANTTVAHNLVNMISLGRYGIVYGLYDCEHASLDLHCILNHIRVVYRFKREEVIFKPHRLDEQWNDIVRHIREKLW